MSFGKALRLAVLFAAFYLFAGAAASGQVCTTMSLSVSTATDGATVTGSGGVFSVSFGNVNGLGILTPAAGVSVSKSASGAIYTTPVRVAVNYTGCVGGTRTVRLYQDSTASAASQTTAREGGAPSSVVSVPTSQATERTISTSPADGATLTRYVGVFVSNANGASRVSGILAPKFIYRLVSQ